MDSLPMVSPSCSLDEAGLRSQLARYRAAAQDASVLTRAERRLVVRVSEQVPDAVIEELVAVERVCCPFFEFDWQPARRQLAVAVTSAEHEPALDGIAFALGVAD
jgi:hypothetical protein